MGRLHAVLPEQNPEGGIKGYAAQRREIKRVRAPGRVSSFFS